MSGQPDPTSLLFWASWSDPPAEDLAREECLLEEAAAGRPALYAYGWTRPALVLGYGQKAMEGIDLAWCESAGIPVVRRCTGGSGVFNDGDLSLSLALPADHPWAGSIHDLYAAFVNTIRRALSALGVEAVPWRPEDGTPRHRSPICFEDHLAESLLLDGRKILGCAQIRRRRAVLVHGTVLFRLDAAVQARIYGVEEARIARAMAPLPELEQLTPPALAETVAAFLAEAMGLSGAVPTGPPPLPDALRPRLSDPRWVILSGRMSS